MHGFDGILAFSVRVLEQIARGDFERFIRGDIQAATGYTMAVPLP